MTLKLLSKVYIWSPVYIISPLILLLYHMILYIYFFLDLAFSASKYIPKGFWMTG